MWRSIEEVITGRTRNAFVGEPARGFESHLLRQYKRLTVGGWRNHNFAKWQGYVLFSEGELEYFHFSVVTTL